MCSRRFVLETDGPIDYLRLDMLPAKLFLVAHAYSRGASVQRPVLNRSIAITTPTDNPAWTVAYNTNPEIMFTSCNKSKGIPSTWSSIYPAKLFRESNSG